MTHRCPQPEALEVAQTCTASLRGDPNAVFALVTAEDVLPRVLRGFGPLPAVTGTSGLSGPWTQAGSQRVVHLADGSQLREQLDLYVPPERFAYHVWGFSHALLRTLVAGGRGEWHFRPDPARPGRTLVDWTYTFTAHGPLQRPAVWLIVRLLWRGYMQRCLQACKAALGEAR